jgi:hypothetical protein
MGPVAVVVALVVWTALLPQIVCRGLLVKTNRPWTFELYPLAIGMTSTICSQQTKSSSLPPPVCLLPPAPTQHVDIGAGGDGSSEQRIIIPNGNNDEDDDNDSLDLTDKACNCITRAYVSREPTSADKAETSSKMSQQQQHDFDVVVDDIG